MFSPTRPCSLLETAHSLPNKRPVDIHTDTVLFFIMIHDNPKRVPPVAHRVEFCSGLLDRVLTGETSGWQPLENSSEASVGQDGLGAS
jgi:hypothetical protein